MRTRYQTAKAAPIQKVSGAAIASLATTIVFWALHQYAGVDLPSEVSAAITGLIALTVGYLTPIAPGEIEPVTASTAHDRH